jgi:hypothetical protein
VVTEEIREAARALYISEFSRPPEDWNLEAMEEPMPLEAMLLWPEGGWNEEAFLAQQARANCLKVTSLPYKSLDRCLLTSVPSPS